MEKAGEVCLRSDLATAKGLVAPESAQAALLAGSGQGCFCAYEAGTAPGWGVHPQKTIFAAGKQLI